MHRLKFRDFLNLLLLKPQRLKEHATEAIIQKTHHPVPGTFPEVSDAAREGARREGRTWEQPHHAQIRSLVFNLPNTSETKFCREHYRLSSLSSAVLNRTGSFIKSPSDDNTEVSTYSRILPRSDAELLRSPSLLQSASARTASLQSRGTGGTHTAPIPPPSGRRRPCRAAAPPPVPSPRRAPCARPLRASRRRAAGRACRTQRDG